MSAARTSQSTVSPLACATGGRWRQYRRLLVKLRSGEPYPGRLYPSSVFHLLAPDLQKSLLTTNVHSTELVVLPYGVGPLLDGLCRNQNLYQELMNNVCPDARTSHFRIFLSKTTQPGRVLAMILAVAVAAMALGTTSSSAGTYWSGVAREGSGDDRRQRYRRHACA